MPYSAQRTLPPKRDFLPCANDLFVASCDGNCRWLQVGGNAVMLSPSAKTAPYGFFCSESIQIGHDIVILP
jgi:hypothetical protein